MLPGRRSACRRSRSRCRSPTDCRWASNSRRHTATRAGCCAPRSGSNRCCAAQATDMTADEQAIRDMIAAWMAATKAGDLEGTLRLVADDVVFLGAGRPSMRKEGFVAASRARESDGSPVDGTVDIQEGRVFGDWAYCWTQIAVTVTPAGGGTPTRLAGPALSILHKEPGGRWVIVRDANMLTPERS